MYVYCGFETAWEKNKVSPWCSIFDKSDLEVSLKTNLTLFPLYAIYSAIIVLFHIAA